VQRFTLFDVYVNGLQPLADTDRVSNTSTTKRFER
jgi:hypothetical protein